MRTDDVARQLDTERAGRIARHDRDAFEQLVAEYGGVAWSLAVRIVRDQSLAEETVQDAFTNVWRHAASFDPAVASLEAWVLRLVRNAAIDRVRYEARRRPRRVDGTPAQVVDVAAAADALPETMPSNDPFASAWAETQHREIAAALGDLSDEHREVLAYAHFGGLSQTEIAERLGLPLGTVKTRTHRALIRLRDIFGARGIIDSEDAS